MVDEAPPDKSCSVCRDEPAAFLETGIIVGVVFEDGIILGFGTTAEGPIVADQECVNFHSMASNIYCCGLGIADNAKELRDMVCSQLELGSSRQASIVPACTFLESNHSLWSSHQGHFSAALMLGGVDGTDVLLHSICPHGSFNALPFATMGSGSSAAWAVFESDHNGGISRDDGIKLVTKAITSGIVDHLGSRKYICIDMCVITKVKVEYEYVRDHMPVPNNRTFPKPRDDQMTEASGDEFWSRLESSLKVEELEIEIQEIKRENLTMKKKLEDLQGTCEEDLISKIAGVELLVDALIHGQVDHKDFKEPLERLIHELQQHRKLIVVKTRVSFEKYKLLKGTAPLNELDNLSKEAAAEKWRQWREQNYGKKLIARTTLVPATDIKPLTPEENREQLMLVDTKVKDLQTQNASLVSVIAAPARDILLVAGLWFSIFPYNTLYTEAPKVGCGKDKVWVYLVTIMSGVIFGLSLSGFSWLGILSLRNNLKVKERLNLKCEGVRLVIIRLRDRRSFMAQVDVISHAIESEELDKQEQTLDDIIETNTFRSVLIRWGQGIVGGHLLVVLLYLGFWVTAICRRACVDPLYRHHLH